jgi:hypothetical protein
MTTVANRSESYSQYGAVTLGNVPAANRGFQGYLAGMRLSNAVRYSSAFSPHLYEAGSVSCTDSAFAGGTVSRVDWSVDSGSGTVSAVYLWTAAGWQQVGGANPTSPLTGLAVTVPGGGSIVKVALAPLAGGLQLVTPTLDWVQVTSSAAGVRTRTRPQRIGPYLLPMSGVML